MKAYNYIGYFRPISGLFQAYFRPILGKLLGKCFSAPLSPGRLSVGVRGGAGEEGAIPVPFGEPI
jgi:hypothetical protein